MNILEGKKREQKEVHERSKEISAKADEELIKEIHQFINNDLNLAQSIATTVATDMKLLETLEQSFDLESTCMCLSMYLTVWEILIRFYERSSSNQNWLSLNREKGQSEQNRKEECIQRFNNGLDVYVFYSIVRMRKSSSLPARLSGILCKRSKILSTQEIAPWYARKRNPIALMTYSMNC